MDPRVKTSKSGLEQQLSLSLRLADMMSEAYEALSNAGTSPTSPGLNNSLQRLNRELTRVFEVIQGSDNAPTTQAVAATHELERQWKQVKAQLPVR